MHLPKQAAVIKMQAEGLDPAILDMDPNTPASAVGVAAAPAPAGPPGGLLAGIQNAPKLKKSTPAPPANDEPVQKSTGNPMLDAIQNRPKLKKVNRDGDDAPKPPAPKPAAGGDLMAQIAGGRNKLKKASDSPAVEPPPPKPAEMSLQSQISGGLASLKKAKATPPPPKKQEEEKQTGGFNVNMLKQASAVGSKKENNQNDSDDNWSDDDGDDLSSKKPAAPVAPSPPPKPAGTSTLRPKTPPPAAKPDPVKDAMLRLDQTNAARAASPPPPAAPAVTETPVEAIGSQASAEGMAPPAEARVPAISRQSIQSSPAPAPVPAHHSALNVSLEDVKQLQRRKSSLTGMGGEIGSSELKTLRMKVEQLEQQLTQERIKVRQLQDRIRVSQKGEGAGVDADKKLNKALALIVQLIGKERVQQHLEVHEGQKGSKRDVLQSLIEIYKEDKLKEQQSPSPNKYSRAQVSRGSPPPRTMRAKKRVDPGPQPFRSRIDSYYRINGVA